VKRFLSVKSDFYASNDEKERKEDSDLLSKFNFTSSDESENFSSPSLRVAVMLLPLTR
jgi:hypothetical protein